MLIEMAQVRVSLLGAFEIATGDGRAIRIDTRKARALLAVLLMAKGASMRREQLADLLWSRVGTRQSLASLSQAIYNIKRAVGDVAPDLITAETDIVAIDRSQARIDVWELEAAATANDEVGQRRCLELYSAGFLEDLVIATEEGYSQWRNAERVRLDGMAAGAGAALMAAWESAPEVAEMARVDRLLSIDPYCEPAIRVRMILLAREGRKPAAIEAGEAFTKLLSSELGISPSKDLFDLLARIRTNDDFFVSHVVKPAEQAGRSHNTARLLFVAAILTGFVAVWVMFARAPPQPLENARLLVRPFEPSGGVDPQLAAGFSDDLSTSLVRLSALDVLSRESGRLIVDSEDRSSGASHVLRGRMRGDSEQWVLNVWITEVDSGREIWADRFRGSANEPRVLQDKIVSRISDRIGLELLPVPKAAPSRLPPRSVPAYMRALSRLYSGTPEGNAVAISALRDLAVANPEAIEPVAALAVAFERVAFEADDFAKAARLHWLEGYLELKKHLASAEAASPELLASRARLALRRLDHVEAQGLARRSLALDGSNVVALEVLAQSHALSGDTEAAREFGTRAILLSPATPENGYLALATAAFVDGDMAAASDAVGIAFEGTTDHSLGLLALRAAIFGNNVDKARAEAAFDDLLNAVRSRPFGAWRMGTVAFTNPRAATWRRPTGAEASSLISFAVESANARFRGGLINASGQSYPDEAVRSFDPLSGQEIEELLFNRRISGQQTWQVLEDWTQIRTADGTIYQDGAFGPLAGAQEGHSYVIDGRLCDQWIWDKVEIENCHLVLRTGEGETYAFVGETGWFPFVAEGPESSPDPRDLP
ncbi:BTAD domain-containing putative transcriptional regulator [Halovulum sp. GXIMD14794]